MKQSKKLLLVVIGTILVTVMATVFITGLLPQKLNETSHIKTVLVVLKAEGGIARRAIKQDIDWLFVNVSTKQVVTKKTDDSIAEVELPCNEDSEKNYWTVSAKSKLYSGVAQLSDRDLKSGKFSVFLSEIQSAIDVELFVEKSAIATTAIPIKWNIPAGINVKINIQKEGEAPLFYAPPNLFTANHKNNETMLRMPSESGGYVIRLYDTKHTKDPLKELKIEVKKAHIEIKAPSEAFAGTRISLSWESPEGSQGQINIKEKSEKVEYYSRYHVRTKGEKSTKLILPSKEGMYAFRWYDFYSKKLLVERAILIKKANIEILVKSKAMVGEKVLVRWRAPIGSVATVYLRSSVDDKTEAHFTVNGKLESEILMPEKAGRYYLTWIGDGDKQEMKRQVIEVIEDS